MARFQELLDTLGVGEDGVSVAYPDTFIDDIRGAYDEDFSGPVAKISVLEADLAMAHAEIERLKAHNYDLLMQIPTNTPDENSDESDENGEDAGDEPRGMDRLFSEKE